MKAKHLCLSILSLAALSACSSSGSGPQSMTPTTPPPSTPPSNTTIGPISAGHPNNIDSTSSNDPVSEDFSSTSATLSVTGDDGSAVVANQTQGRFENPELVNYDASTNSLTFNVHQQNANFTKTVGPILLANPGDVPNLENDALAVLISAYPDLFPARADFDPQDFANDPEGADNALIALQDIGGEANNEYLAALSEVALEIQSNDFFTYVFDDGTRYYQGKITGNNSGVTTNYAALGAWLIPAAANGQNVDIYGATVFGKRTPASEVPRTGTATYVASIVGWLTRLGNVEELRGDVSLGVNFGTREIDVNIDADIVVPGADGNSVFSDIATLEGTAFIASGSSRFGGSLIGDVDPSIRGSIDGSFFGPNAAEVGGTFTFNNENMAGSAAYIGTN